jgi:hypothetical protein
MSLWIEWKHGSLRCLQEGCPNSDDCCVHLSSQIKLYSMQHRQSKNGQQKTIKMWSFAVFMLYANFTSNACKIFIRLCCLLGYREVYKRRFDPFILNFLIQSSMGWQGSFHLLLGIDCKELPVPVHVTAKCPFVFGHCLSRSSRSVSFRTVSPGCLLRNAYSCTLFSNRLLKSPERLDHSSGVSMFKLLKFGHSW